MAWIRSGDAITLSKFNLAKGRWCTPPSSLASTWTPVTFAGFEKLMKTCDPHIIGKLGWCTSPLCHWLPLKIPTLREIWYGSLWCSIWTWWIREIKYTVQLPLMRGLQMNQQIQEMSKIQWVSNWKSLNNNLWSAALWGTILPNSLLQLVLEMEMKLG